MSMTTDLGERSAENDLVPLERLTTTGLTIVNSGFTLYVTRMVNGRRVVLGVAAPKVSTVRHTPKVVFHEDDVLGPIPGIAPENHLYSIDLREFDISAGAEGTGAGAEAVGFDMIVDFNSVSCGLELAPDWRARTPWVPFDGGQVVAIPDQYYVQQECQWTECHHNPKGKEISRRQRLTSLVTHMPPAQNIPTIVLTSRKNRSNPVSIQFKGGPVFAALTNFPEASDPGSYAVDLSHIEAMFKLSTVVDEPRFTLGWIINSPLNVPAMPQWPAWLTGVLRQETLVGRPHCGARQMAEPTA